MPEELCAGFEVLAISTFGIANKRYKKSRPVKMGRLFS